MLNCKQKFIIILLDTLDYHSFLPVTQISYYSFLSLFGKHKFLTLWVLDIKLGVPYQAIPSLLLRDESGCSKSSVVICAIHEVSIFIFQRRKQGLGKKEACESFYPWENASFQGRREISEKQVSLLSPGQPAATQQNRF